MPLMDEFKEERAEIKNRSFKEKCSYFWDYYKWHVIGGAIGLFVVVSLIHTILSQKDTAFYAAFLNIGQSLFSEEYKNEFASSIGIDTSKETVYFDIMPLELSVMDDATVATAQKIMVYVSAGDLDVIIADKAATDHYSYLGTMMDLRDFLTPEEVKKYEPYFYYMDQTKLQKTNGETNADLPDYPADPADPSTMEEPIPVGIRIDGCKKFSEAHYLPGPTYFTVVTNTSHPDIAHTLLEYIWEEQ